MQKVLWPATTRLGRKRVWTACYLSQRHSHQVAELGIPRVVLEKRARLYKRQRHGSGLSVPSPSNTASASSKFVEEKSKEPAPSMDLNQMIESYSNKTPDNMDLNALLEFGKNASEGTLLKSAMRLHEELPIRLAQKVVDLSHLPHELSNMPAIKEVKNLYISSFEELVSLPVPNSILKERKLTNHVKEIYERHSGVLWSVARGVYQLKRKHKQENLTRFCLPETFPGIQTFLDNFFLSRLDIRMLIGQHIALHEHIDGWVGLFCLRTSPFEISQSAARSAANACLQRYSVAPRVNVRFRDEMSAQCIIPFPYVPAFMHHILFEILKNSMRAVIERGSGELKPVEVVIGAVDGSGSEISIDVLDKGGGFDSEEELKRSWSYMYSTASEKDSKELFEELHRSLGRDFDSNEHGLPIAGLGFGLPISRVFAKYLGGDLELSNHDGGTRARLVMAIQQKHIS